MRSYNELFIDEFHNSQIIDETYADIYNNQGFKANKKIPDEFQKILTKAYPL